MKKLSLRVDDVRVNSFEVGAEELNAGGTVKGAEALTRFTRCFDDTCFASCNLTECPGDC